MKTLPTFLICCLSLLSVQDAMGQGDTLPRHGGVVPLVGEMSFELVIADSGAEVFVVDDSEDFATDGMTAKIAVVTDGNPQEWALLPTGGNRLSARGAPSTAASAFWSS